MDIVFFCRSCGARFRVAPRMAGKAGRCRRCGQHTTIPRAEEVASMTAMPAVAAASAARRDTPPPIPAESPASSLGAWLKAGMSQVGLVPLNDDWSPPRPVRPSALDDDGDSKPYALAGPPPRDRGPSGAPAGALARLRRRGIGAVQKVFRWLNEGAYVASIPFLIVLLVGAAVKSRPMALLGAAFVVPLNLGRLAAGAVDLALVPLRDGFAARRLRKPLRRVAEPILTIVLVLLGFTFIPWLSAGRPARGDLADRLRDGASGLEREIAAEVGQVADEARKVDVKDLGRRARRRLDAPDDNHRGGTP